MQLGPVTKRSGEMPFFNKKTTVNGPYKMSLFYRGSVTFWYEAFLNLNDDKYDHSLELFLHFEKKKSI